MKLSIIYVNYNTTQLLIDCLQSLPNLGTAIEYEIIVVDNNSANFDPTKITNIVPEARVIQSNENIGFGKANNIGAELATGEYVWLLNTDTLVPKDNHIDQALSFLDQYPDYAGLLPLLTDKHGEVQPTQVAYFPSPSKIIWNIPVRFLAKLLPSLHRLWSRTNLDYSAPTERDLEVGVSAAMIIRRDAFAQVDGFSSEYFMFYEDSDLCYKLHQKGYRLRWFINSHIIHLWGKSITGKGSNLKRKRLYYASQDIYLRKWHGPLAGWAIKILRLPLVITQHLFTS